MELNFPFSCLVALFIDPLYFYVPKIIYTTPNSIAYINPSSTLRVFGRGDLVIDPKEIAWKYLRSDFAVDDPWC